MTQYIVRRLLLLPVVLFVLITLSFFMMKMAPGSPFSQERKMPPEIQRSLDEYWHIGEPVWKQYGYYMGKLILEGDMGWSMKLQGTKVSEIIWRYLPASAELGLWSIALALALGLSAGIIAGIRQNTRFDYSSMSLAMVGISIPTFVFGPLLVLLLARKLHWLDSGGWDRPSHLIMPVITLALPFASRIARLARAGMLEVINQDYIRTARAKGLFESRVVMLHALKGALLPVVSFLGPGMAGLLTGSLVVEQIFSVPGLGKEFVTTALNRDYTVVMGTVIAYGTLQIIFNLIVDIVYGILDPRIRYS